MIGDGRLEESRLFVDDAARQRFINALSERVERYNVRIYLVVCKSSAVGTYRGQRLNCLRSG